MNNKRVIVTGCCGFIGSHLLKAIPIEWDVIGIDDLSNGDERHFNRCDQRIRGTVRENIQRIGGSVDYIFHLAALPRVQYSIDYPRSSHKANVDDTLAVLEYAKERGPKVIFSSSSAIYGAQKLYPTPEDAEKLPMSPYALQKLTGDIYTDLFNKMYGLPTVALRYFNVYGEGQNGSHPYATVVAKFLELKKQGKPLTIHGDGEQVRDMTYVEDVVRANLSAATSDVTGAFNIGGGVYYSVNEVAEMVGGETVSESPREGDPRKSLADITKANVLLDWRPRVTLDSWIKSQLA